MYKCKCGKEYENRQSYVAHCGHCKIHLGHEPLDRFGDSRAWMRGKTVDDPRVERICELSANARRGKPGTPHTEEFKQFISKVARENAKNHINGWKAGSSKIHNKYETFTEEFLRSRGISYETEVIIPQSVLGKSGSYYQLDFLIDGRIDLEIDGSSHDQTYDEIRDSYVNKLYTVVRLNHKDSLEILKSLLENFIEQLNYNCKSLSDYIVE